MNDVEMETMTAKSDTNKSGKVVVDEEPDDQMLQQRRKRIEILRKIAKQMRKKTQNVGDIKSNEDWDNILRVKERHLLVFSMLGLATSVFQSYYKWDNRCNYYEQWDPARIEYVEKEMCFYTVWKQLEPGNPPPFKILEARNTLTIDNVNSNSAEWLILIASQSVLTGTTLITIVLLVQYYFLKLQERRREWSGMEEIELMETTGEEASRRRQQFKRSYNFWESSLLWQLMAEIIIHLIHPFIWVEVARFALFEGQTMYEIFECLIFCRMYLVLRNIYINDDIYIFRNDIVNSNKELQKSNFSISAKSTFKIMFYQHPALMVGLSVIGTIIIFGFIIFVIERNGNPMFEVLFPDCYWFVWVTISTIGYGDLSALSSTGRIVVIVMAIISLLIMTIFSGIVTNLLSPTREQKYVQSYLARRESELEYKKAAVNLIVTVHREKKAMRNMRNPTNRLLGRRSPLVYAAIKRLRSCRLAVRESIGSASDPIVDIKLQTAILLANRLNELLDDQGAQIVRLDDKMMRSTAFIKSRVMKNTGGSGGPSKSHNRRASSPGRKKSFKL